MADQYQFDMHDTFLYHAVMIQLLTRTDSIVMSHHVARKNVQRFRLLTNDSYSAEADEHL